MNIGQRTRGQKIDQERYRRITWFFTSVIAHVILWDILLRRLLPARVLASRPQRWRGLSRRFRQLAIDMGGVMIKLGQFVSSRVDVLPPEVTEELQGLQDEVPAVPTAAILAVLTSELGDLSEHFAEIEPEPLAAASLGQVYRAWLRPRMAGTERGVPVVVKVQRPGIDSIVKTDLAALSSVAHWIMRYGPVRRRADVPALLDEFARTLWEELDYKLEAANAERFAEMFTGNDGVYIPLVYRNHSTERILVLENVEAIKIVDLEALEAAGVDRREVADRLLETYFQQIFREGFFHADPHPGNLFVRPRTDLPWEPESGPRPFHLIFVDFGMVGRIQELTGDNLRQVLFAVTRRDARALTEAYRDLGFFLPTADLDRITEAQEVLLEELWGRNLLELSSPDPEEVQELTKEFKDILFDFPFQVPQDFVYLGRAIGMLSGLSSQLDPEINPWYQVEKYGRQMLRSREGRQAGIEGILETVRPLVELPLQLQRVLTAAERGRLRVEAAPDRATIRRLERIERRLAQLQWSVLAAAGLVSGTLFFLNHKSELEDKN